MAPTNTTGYRTIDLFAGAGGMTEGFKQHGFTPLFANEFEEPAFETFSRNHPEAEISLDPIESLDAGKLRRRFGLGRGDLDALIGGPPCQGFSSYGQRNPEDQRNRLYEYFLDFLYEFKPKTFVIENVVGILSMDSGEIIEDIVTRCESFGYCVDVSTLDAVCFGVPQSRRRVFIIGSADGKLIPAPQPTHGEKNGCGTFSQSDGTETLLPLVTVRDAISDLASSVLTPKQTHDKLPYPHTDGPLTPYQKQSRKDCTDLVHHSAKQMLGIRRLRLALMRQGEYGTRVKTRVKKEGLAPELIDELLSRDGLRNPDECRMEDRDKETKLREILLAENVNQEDLLESLNAKGFANKYRRFKWDQPSHTLVAHMARDCSDYVHPDIDRFVSVREAARLQSFPDSYYFCGSQFRQFKQIGNAVPPLLASAIAGTIRQRLDTNQGKSLKNAKNGSSS